MKNCESKESHYETDTVLAICEKCNDVFIQKYWDDEIDWYIETYSANTCCKCAST